MNKRFVYAVRIWNKDGHQPNGVPFRITEQDGYESIEILEDAGFITL